MDLGPLLAVGGALWGFACGISTHGKGALARRATVPVRGTTPGASAAIGGVPGDVSVFFNGLLEAL
jgi:hypothetical protein